MVTRRTLSLAIVAIVCALSARTAARTPRDSSAAESTLPADATGKDIYVAACATCHGIDGTGSPPSVVGFELPLPNGHDFPDFTDCATNTVEPLGDWMAVAHRGGPVRALDRRMPAFGDALTGDQIERAIKYVWSFCDDPAWPRGDLNLPRAFFTEKAFPENETVWMTAVATSGARSVTNELIYEHRIGARWQWELRAPFGAQQTAPGEPWRRSLGDLEIGFRRTIQADLERGRILAVGADVKLPTGNEELGLGSGYTIVEPFAMWGQMIGASGFVQTHVGYEVAPDRARGRNEAFARTAFGYSLSQDHGFGRAWTPMVEVLAARPQGAATEWDVVPQAQVSMSKLQHVLVSVGVRIPITERDVRKPQVLAYFQWDWFDGGLFEFWK